VLTAAQVNTYLQEQTVMVFANSTARTTALSGVLAEGMMSYLQDTNSVEVYNGSSWVALASGDVTEVQAGTGISVASGTGPIPVVTNTMATAINAAGDLIYGTANDTFTRLGIGTAGQVLKVNSGATAPEWGTVATASGLTFISRTAFSNVASQAIDGVFTSTYDNYLIILEDCSAATAADDLYLQLRYAGPTTETGTYYGWCETFDLSGAEGGLGWSSVSAAVISTATGTSVNTGSGHLVIQRVGNSSEKAAITGTYTENETLSGFTIFGGSVNTARTYTGFLLKSSSTNITGVVTVYGYAKS
jgi:hypothetical protein